MLQLKNLLPDALRRGRISRQVEATKMVEIFNELIKEKLPPGQVEDVTAISYKDQILNVSCQNSPAAHWIASREQEMLSLLSRQIPEARSIKIKIQIKSL